MHESRLDLGHQPKLSRGAALSKVGDRETLHYVTEHPNRETGVLQL